MAKFDNQVDAFVGKTIANMDDHFRLKVFQLYVDIIDGTPRISGTLRNSWMFGQRVTSEKPKKQEYPIGSENANISAAAGKLPGISGDSVVFIFSNMEYALAVERGLGPGNRTPRRMVQRAIELMKRDG